MSTAFEQLGLDLEGWKSIAAHLGLSERTARSLRRREDNPLPVRTFNGRIWASSAELTAWLEGEMQANCQPLPKDAA